MLSKILAQYVDSSGNRLSSSKIISARNIRPAGVIRPRVVGPWSPPAIYTAIASINVDPNPTWVALNPNNRSAWVTHVSGNTVDQIDVSTNTLINTITVGNEPSSIAVTPDNTAAWVTNSLDGTISIIDISSSSVSTFSSTPILNPVVIAASPNNSMWVSSSVFGDPILEFDISTNAVKTTVILASTTTVVGIAVGPSHGGTYFVWIVDSDFNQLTNIDGSTGGPLTTTNLPYTPALVAVSPDNSFVWVTHPGDGFVSQINVATLAVNTILTPPGPIFITVSPDSQYVWVTCFYGVIVQINVAAATVVNLIYNGGPMIPLGIAVDPTNTSFWISDVENNVVDRFPILEVPLFTVRGSSLVNYGEVTLNISVFAGVTIDLSTLISVGGGATLSYSINDGTGSLVGSILTVPMSGSVQILVLSSQTGAQSSGAILLDMIITVTIPDNGGYVRPNYTAQLSNSERTAIKSATTIYNAANIFASLNPTVAPRFKNTADYIAYKKALTLVNGTPPIVNGLPARPIQTSLLLNPACAPGFTGNGCVSGPF